MYKIVHVAAEVWVFGIFFFPLFGRAEINQVSRILDDKLSTMEWFCGNDTTTFTTDILYL